MPDRVPVTVLMPVYNTRRYVLAALRSIVGQTWRDFEFLIINDGSTDGSDALLRLLDDPRIRLINQPHAGIVAALNRGIAEARGELIARMDSDDVALPRRLELQTAYMLQHPRVHLLGTRFTYIDPRGRALCTPQWPCEDVDIRAALPVYNCLTHPTVMFRRRSALEAGGYRADLEYQEDYDLWLRMIDRWQVAQLPEVLLYYRLSGSSVSFRNRRQQSSMLDAMVKELHRQRRLEGQDMLQRGGSAEQLRRTLAPSVAPWRHRWARQMYGLAAGCLQAGRRTAALRFALEAVWNDPLWQWNWTLLGRACVPGWLHVAAMRARRRFRRPITAPIAEPALAAVADALAGTPLRIADTLERPKPGQMP